jgi:aminoglycoside phosphotransferase (APT) family kinase protein
VEEWPSIAKGRRVSLVHGDLYSRHLLVEGGALSGVIDWGDMHLNDPGIDLTIGFLFFPPAARESFFAAYGGAGEATIRLARFRAVSHSLAVLPYALQTADGALERETRRALAWAAG